MHLIDVRAGNLGHGLYVVRRVRTGDHRHQLTHIIMQDLAILCVGVGGQRADTLLDLFPCALHHPVEHLAARHDKRYLAAHLRDHGAERDALGKVCVVDGLAGELHSEVIHAARAEVADNVGQQIAHTNTLPELTGNLDLHRLRYAEPTQAADVGCRHIRIADAGRKRADRAEQVHMAVRAEHNVAGLDESRLQHDVLADAMVDVKELFNALTHCTLADDFLVVRDLFRVRRCLQVKGIGDLIRVPDLRILPHLLFKLQHAVSAAEIACGREVNMAPYAVADIHLMAAGALHDFHDCCFSHHCSSFHIIVLIL